MEHLDLLLVLIDDLFHLVGVTFVRPLPLGIALAHLGVREVVLLLDLDDAVCVLLFELRELDAHLVANGTLQLRRKGAGVWVVGVPERLGS